MIYQYENMLTGELVEIDQPMGSPVAPMGCRRVFSSGIVAKPNGSTGTFSK